MKYNSAIVDDRAEDCAYIRDLAMCWADERGLTLEIEVFPSAEAFLFRYADKKDYDILLFDIEMGGMDGVSLARCIRADNEDVQIIFITGFPDFIAQGYEVAALHYLMKPVSAEKLAEVLDRAVKKRGVREKTVLFEIANETVRLPAADILCAEALSHSCVLTTKNGSLEVKVGIAALEKLLGIDFIRCHRSYLVNLRCIKRLSRTDVTLDNDRKIPLSRANYQAVNQAFIRYHRGEH